ncbi:PREDICTED: coiled-coil domain-containing protein 47 [Nicrophorus vespilloides]|uniref:PAT complex subunit CCDC47 n=1 Tax=Nicrophorus vespilloides TaxID=110193 RepID=A0ABM1NDS1_NICVS|nr:PREDICTED: coiled-coil domain-containing protein 47 [Nicrophorus vespilloides]XP_017784973.1 PREDICTED: coiled-coil domain-containing protein 47 [Nicrophorus vespilloides]
MKLWIVFMHVLLVSCSVWANYQDQQDNEFAEFEEFESDDAFVQSTGAENLMKEPEPIDADNIFITDDDDGDIIINDDSEFEHFQDTEEFEGFAESREEKIEVEPKITITKVPIHFRANWDSYWLEILMVTGLIVYFINFATGKSKNTMLANTWFQSHKQLLEDNFTLVGDDGALEHIKESGGLLKESENTFTLWCSGRTCCEGMLVELKLIKRQDLVAVISGMMRPTLDQVHIKVTMDSDAMEPFVFCVASKKTATHVSKETNDISVYCPERKSGERYNIPSNFQVMSEILEATSAMLDSKVTAILNKYTDLVDYIHISDQYSGAKQTEDTGALKLPEVKKVLLFGFNMPVKGMSPTEAVEQLKPLMVLVFYCIEKVKRFRLSKESKTKADKNRLRVEEVFLKSTHAARAEAAANRREEKRRLEKEKVMAEEDPERQRRWEEKDQKRQAKKRAPKMKQLKVKAL